MRSSTWQARLAIVLCSVVALSALIGGALLTLAPDGHLAGLSLTLLDGTPFRDYFLPGLILVLVIGGGMSAATVAQLGGARRAPALTGAAGFALVIWLAAQLLLIGPMHPLQPILIVVGVALLLISWTQTRAR